VKRSPDIALAIEFDVSAGLSTPVTAWHVDRSRNDLQACAQLLRCRTRLSEATAVLLQLAQVAHEAALQDVASPMPGYTHMQAAQVMTPGFFVSAIVEHALSTAEALLTTYDRINLCQLGAGPLAGQELAWDREWLAQAVGCSGPVPHALVAVASREWLLRVSSDISTAAVGFSRLLTDLMSWTSSAYAFAELPDDLSGISASMPQKKNYPLLERLRGRTGHLIAHYADFATGQRNTPFTNMVEVSKEAGLRSETMFDDFVTTVTGLTLVIENLKWDKPRMRSLCEEDHFGAFSLANELTLRGGVPWRTAQRIAGQFVVSFLSSNSDACEEPAHKLTRIAADHGHTLHDPKIYLTSFWDVDEQLQRRLSSGSASPGSVIALLAEQQDRLSHLTAELESRTSAVSNAISATDSAIEAARRS
jgi:argininosuccinate lyase